MRPVERNSLKRPALVSAFIAALYFFHFNVLLNHLVDVPLWDEWDNLPPKKLSWAWASGFFNEHRILSTRLQIWVLWAVNGLDYRTHVIWNFLIYGLFLVVFAGLLAKILRDRAELWWGLAFLPFLLSPMGHQVFDWGLNSSFIFAPLFAFSGAFFLFDRDLPWGRLAAGLICLAASTYSFSAGLVMSLVIAVFFVAHRITLKDFKKAFAAALPLCALWAFWFRGYPSHAGASQHALPWTPAFWKFFALMFSQAMGVQGHSVVIAAMASLALLFPLVALLFKKRSDAASWCLLALGFSAVGAVAAVAVGRGLSDAAKSSRYAFMALLYLPLAAAAWAHRTEGSARRKQILFIFFALTAVGNFDDWRFEREYNRPFKARLLGLFCVERSLLAEKESSAIFCPDIYPVPLADHLEKAKGLDLSFYHRIKGLHWRH